MVAFLLKCWLNLKMLFFRSYRNYVLGIIQDAHTLQRKMKVLISQEVTQTLSAVSFKMVYF
jgi:hypothetical protein